MSLLLLFQAAAAATATGVPIDAVGAAPQRRPVYYQSRFEVLAPLVSAAPATAGWHKPLSVAPPVAKAQAGSSFVPYNTAQLSVNFTNYGWHQPLSTAAPVAKPQLGYAFVPYNTAQLSVNFTNYGWYRPLSPAPAVARARQGDSFVPFNTAQSVRGVPLAMGGASPRVRQTYYQARFETPYPAGQVVATATTLDWQQPLSTIPYSVAYRPQQYPFDPPRFGEIAPSPVESGTILMPGKAGGGGFSRKRWREIQEQEAAERRVVLEAQKQVRDEAARVKLEAQTARAAKIAAKAESVADKARLDAVVQASDGAKQFAEQSSKEEAEFLAAMLAEIANQEDEDEVIMLLLGL